MEDPATLSRLWSTDAGDGVLNVTPDSFSDGGQFFSIDKQLLMRTDDWRGRRHH